MTLPIRIIITVFVFICSIVLSLSGVFFGIACLPLTGKTLGYIDDLAALCQRFLAAACPDALFFQRTTGAVLAAVN